MNQNAEIGARLREFAISKFGSVAELERTIQVPKNALSQYITGRTGVGTKLQAKLRDSGCDIEWLMTGRHSEEDVRTIRFHADKPITPELKERAERIVQKLIDHPNADSTLIEKIIDDILGE